MALPERDRDVIQVGQVLDKYELLERVGQGGMAIVYRGLDRSLKRVVAVKILHKHLSDYQEARDRFEREAQAVAKLRHENILEIFDYAAKEDSEDDQATHLWTREPRFLQATCPLLRHVSDSGRTHPIHIARGHAVRVDTLPDKSNSPSQ